ncbi:tetratricopeptide repeat protein [Pontiellaceae bacterium B1224]|nr:tetratricopeptide repeat protein [Pontiellaceae bacterium B1224]
MSYLKNSVSLSLFLLVLQAGAQNKWPVSNHWKTDQFQNAFTASYGIDAAVEPRIRPEAQEVLRSVADKMKDQNRKGAVIKLQESIWLKNSPALQFSLANLLVEEARNEDAIGHYERAIDLFPTYRDAYRNLAFVLVRADRAAEALPLLSRSIELGANDGLTFGLLAWCHTEAGRHRSALQAYRQAQLIDPEQVQWKQGEAFALLALGQAGPAINTFNELMIENPETLAYVQARADAWMMLGDYDKAIVDLEFVRRSAPASVDSLMALGHLYLQIGLPKLAVDCFLDAAQNADEIEFLYDALDPLLAREYWNEAQQLIDVLQAASEFESPRLIRAQAFLSLEKGQTESAIQSLEKITQADPMDADALLMLAKAYRITKRPAEAALMLEQAALVPAVQLSALLQLGQVQVELGLYDEAITTLERANRLDPQPAIQEYIAAIRNLQF